MSWNIRTLPSTTKYKSSGTAPYNNNDNNNNNFYFCLYSSNYYTYNSTNNHIAKIIIVNLLENKFIFFVNFTCTAIFVITTIITTAGTTKQY